MFVAIGCSDDDSNAPNGPTDASVMAADATSGEDDEDTRARGPDGGSDGELETDVRSAQDAGTKRDTTRGDAGSEDDPARDDASGGAEDVTAVDGGMPEDTTGRDGGARDGGDIAKDAERPDGKTMSDVERRDGRSSRDLGRRDSTVVRDTSPRPRDGGRRGDVSRRPDASGPPTSFAWRKTFGTSSGPDMAHDIAIGPNGALYIAGHVSGPVGGQPHAGGKDAFVAKFDSSGTRQWIRMLGSSSVGERALGVAVASTGRVYIVGSTTEKLAGKGQSNNRENAFIAQYDNSGSRQWVELFRTGTNSSWADIEIDSNGEAVVTGGTLNGAFVARYDSNGTLQNTTKIAPKRHIGVSLEVVDPNTYYVLDLYLLAPAPARERYVLHREGQTSQGTWSTDILTSRRTPQNIVPEIEIDNSSTVHVTGAAKGTVQGRATQRIDAFHATVTPLGQRTRLDRFATSGDDTGSGVAIHPNGQLYTAGLWNAYRQANPPYTESMLRTPLGATETVIRDASESIWTTDLAIDDAGNIYLTGMRKPEADAFIMKL